MKIIFAVKKINHREFQQLPLFLSLSRRCSRPCRQVRSSSSECEHPQLTSQISGICSELHSYVGWALAEVLDYETGEKSRCKDNMVLMAMMVPELTTGRLLSCERKELLSLICFTL